MQNLDWNATRERAEAMTDLDLCGAISDCLAAGKAAADLERSGHQPISKTQGYYHDEISVYRREQARRARAVEKRAAESAKARADAAVARPPEGHPSSAVLLSALKSRALTCPVSRADRAPWLAALAHEMLAAADHDPCAETCYFASEVEAAACDLLGQTISYEAALDAAAAAVDGRFVPPPAWFTSRNF